MRSPVVINFSCRWGGHHLVVGEVWHRIAEAEGPSADRYSRYICGTLSAVAQTPAECERIVDLIQSVESGSQAQAEFEGNDVTLTFSNATVQIDIEANQDWVGRPEGQFDLKEYRAALVAWCRFLGMPESANSLLSVELP